MSARGHDPYALLGVARDASTAEIKRAYELALNRAHCDGAIRHAEDLLRAHETLADPRRREMYDRHGLMPLRERSPGAAPPPTPWRIAQHSTSGAPQRKVRRGWRVPVLAVFALGIAVGIAVAVYVSRHQNALAPINLSPSIATHPTRVICQQPGGGSGYTWIAQPGQAIACRNGARPEIVSQAP